MLLGVCIYPLHIVTRFYENGSLLRYFQRTPLSLEQIIHILKGVTSGMNHLHSEKVIHRDLAARNILLTTSLDAVVSDFGFARFLEEQQDSGKTTSTIGPLRWMSPESLLERIYSPKTDVYSFGVTAWECITRKGPWPDLTVAQVVVKVTSGKHLIIPEVVECPEMLQQVVYSCLQTNPEERPSFQQLFSTLQTLEATIKSVDLPNTVAVEKLELVGEIK